MQLKDLYQHFDKLPAEEQRTFVARYRARRDAEFTADKIDFEEKQAKKGTRKRVPKIELSEEEKTLMKKLGLTQKQLRALRALED